MNIYRKSSRGQGGFTILEVMIALGVLSIGLAGLAIMQINSLQYVHSAHYRSMASTIALDLEERVWLDLAAATMSGCPAVAVDSDEDTTTTAEALIADWSRTAVADGGFGDGLGGLLRIPGLTITLGTAATVGDTTQVPVTLSWNEARFGQSESTTETFAYTMRVFCKVHGVFAPEEETA